MAEAEVEWLEEWLALVDPAEAVADPLSLAEAVADLVALADPLPLAEAVADLVALADPVTLAEPEADFVPLTDPVALAEPEAELLGPETGPVATPLRSSWALSGSFRLELPTWAVLV